MKRTFEEILEDSKKSAALLYHRQAKLELWFTKKDSVSFFNGDRTKIAIATKQDNGKIKVVYYHVDGPSGDFTCPINKLAEELRAYGFLPIVDLMAGKTLDQWANTERWETGLKQLRFVALVNSLPWDISRPMYKMTLDEAINYGNKKAIELGIEIY